MNEKRKDDGLKIAEEKLLPNEEEYLNSVIESFSTHMRGLWKPGGFERGGNTKTPGQCCADSVWLRQGAEFRYSPAQNHIAAIAAVIAVLTTICSTESLNFSICMALRIALRSVSICAAAFCDSTSQRNGWLFFGLPHKGRERRHKFVAGSPLYFFLRSFSHLVGKLHVSFAVADQHRGKSKQFAGRRK